MRFCRELRWSQALFSVLVLLYDTSVFDVRRKLPINVAVNAEDDLRIYDLPTAIIEAVPSYFNKNATDARAALATFRDASQLLTQLLEGGHSTIAGAFRNIGRDQIADDIAKTMKSAGCAR